MKQTEEAKRYIKRIVIWPSTNRAVKALYKELVKRNIAKQEKDEVSIRFEI